MTLNRVWTTNGRAPNIASSHHCIQEKTRVQRDFEMTLSRRLHLFTHCSRHMHQKRSRQRRSQAHHSANICTRQKLVLSPSPFLLLRTACNWSTKEGWSGTDPSTVCSRLRSKMRSCGMYPIASRVSFTTACSMRSGVFSLPRGTQHGVE